MMGALNQCTFPCKEWEARETDLAMERNGLIVDCEQLREELAGKKAAWDLRERELVLLRDNTLEECTRLGMQPEALKASMSGAGEGGSRGNVIQNVINELQKEKDVWASKVGTLPTPPCVLLCAMLC